MYYSYLNKYPRAKQVLVLFQGKGVHVDFLCSNADIYWPFGAIASRRCPRETTSGYGIAFFMLPSPLLEMLKLKLCTSNCYNIVSLRYKAVTADKLHE